MKISFEDVPQDSIPEIYVNGKRYAPEQATETKPAVTLYDILRAKHGAKEWDDVVGMIQTWYYGSYVKASWCATAVSWAAASMGILDQIGGKNENVYHMMNACSGSGRGLFFSKKAGNIPAKIEKGDILFYLWEGTTMTVQSSKHVSICAATTTSDQILSEGGNQKDKICAIYYEKSKLYAVFRPEYTT